VSKYIEGGTITMDSVTIIGNVGTDPELRITPNGKEVVNLNIATYAGKDQSGDSLTTWIKATAWGNLATLINHNISKGTRVRVSGILTEPRIWESKEGEPRCSYEITIFSCHLVKKDVSFETLPDIDSPLVKEAIAIAKGSTSSQEEPHEDIPF